MTRSRSSAADLDGELDPSIVEKLLEAWADELSLPEGTLDVPGVHYVTREDSGVVVVLDLFESQVVVGPSFATGLLRRLGTGEERSKQAVLGVLERFSPEVIGEAALSYAEEIRAPQDVEVAVSPVQNVDLLRDHCTPGEWEESGLIDMPSRIAARRTDGRVAAVAGFERWGPYIAQLGVLVDPRWRGHGYGAAAAARAAQVAQGDQLIPQWRCRIDNHPSRELARRLGFLDVGRLLLVDLDV